MDLTSRELELQVREKMGKYLHRVVISVMIFVIFLIISCIWHTAMSILMSDAVFIIIGGSVPVNITISIAALSIGCLIVMVINLLSLYFLGTHFCFHFITFVLAILTILSTLVLTAFNLYYMSGSSLKMYGTNLYNIINSTDRKEVISKWMGKNNCTDSITCERSITRYVLFRVMGEQIACGLLLGIYGLALIIGAFYVLRMGCIERPHKGSTYSSYHTSAGLIDDSRV